MPKIERKVYLSDIRIPRDEKVDGYFYYACRHTDSGSLPWRGYTLEHRVIVNHYADVVTNFEVTELDPTVLGYKDTLSMAKFFRKYQPLELDTLEDMYASNHI